MNGSFQDGTSDLLSYHIHAKGSIEESYQHHGTKRTAIISMSTNMLFV